MDNNDLHKLLKRGLYKKIADELQQANILSVDKNKIHNNNFIHFEHDLKQKMPFFHTNLLNNMDEAYQIILEGYKREVYWHNAKQGLKSSAMMMGLLCVNLLYTHLDCEIYSNNPNKESKNLKNSIENNKEIEKFIFTCVTGCSLAAAAKYLKYVCLKDINSLAAFEDIYNVADYYDKELGGICLTLGALISILIKCFKLIILSLFEQNLKKNDFTNFADFISVALMLAGIILYLSSFSKFSLDDYEKSAPFSKTIEHLLKKYDFNNGIQQLSQPSQPSMLHGFHDTTTRDKLNLEESRILSDAEHIPLLNVSGGSQMMP